jgi:isoquinoline 1-oxidoreductase subunit beta
VPGWQADKGETLLGSFLKIGADGRVVVAVPQAEMGQGAWSGLAQIAADELGADWRTVSVEPAPLGADYANKGVLIDMLAGVPSGMQGLARWGATRVVEYFEFQITGGSTSIRGFEAPLRAAGAAARAMLCAAAARRWSVDAGACTTANGFVLHKANRAAFVDLLGDLDPDDAPATPVLRDKPLLVGKSLLRLDIPSKVDGSARLPGMAYAAIRQNPIGAARLPLGKVALPAGARLVETPDFIAVVADGWFAAKSALDSLLPLYAPGPNPPGPWLEAGLRAALETAGKPVRDEGDAGSRLDGSVSFDYSLPFLAHACLEPMTATARIADGRCEIWAPTQSASLASWAVAAALDIGSDKVTVYPTLIGGGFGRKVEKDAVVQAALIARAVGRPVQLIWSREEDFSHDMWRPAAVARMRGKASAAGITAWDAKIAVPDVGASFMARNVPATAGDPQAGAAAIEGAVDMPYAMPAVRVTHCLADCNVPLGYWRSVGHSFSGFMVESFVDELAEQAGADPGAFRLAMLADRPRHAAVLRAALRAGGPLGAVSPGVGRGVALVESFGSIVAQVAEVKMIDGTPRVTHVWAAIDCGRVVNPDSVVAQVESGIVYGLTAALHGRVTFQNGAASTTNFDSHPILGLADMPRIDVTIVASTAAPGGVGEPGTPPIAPAVANAIFAAGGGRRRDLPLVRAA